MRFRQASVYVLCACAGRISSASAAPGLAWCGVTRPPGAGAGARWHATEMLVRRCHSAAAAEIVVRPYLVEDELSALALQASIDWVRSLPAESLGGAPPVSLEILNGGKYYYTKDAWDAVRPDIPARLLRLRARRGHASGETFGGAAHNDKNLEPGMELYQSPGSDWCVRIWEIPEDLCLTGPILVGDTIATGTTLVGVLGWLVSKMEAAGSVQDIHVFTIVGASKWASGDGGVIEKLKHVDESLRKHGKVCRGPARRGERNVRKCAGNVVRPFSSKRKRARPHPAGAQRHLRQRLLCSRRQRHRSQPLA